MNNLATKKQRKVLLPAPKRAFQNNSATGEAVCDIHGPYKPVIISHPICPACAQIILEKQNQEDAARILKQREHARFLAAGFPQRHANSGLLNYDVKGDGQQYAKAVATEYINALLEGKRRCLVLSGSTGTGKTHLAVGIGRNVMIQNGTKPPLFTRYAESKHIASDILGAWKREGDSERAAVWRYREPDLLIVDEYGLDDRSEAQIRAVHQILTARYDDDKSTILISNLTPQALAEQLGDRLWSRLGENGRVVQCNWKDQRTMFSGWGK